MKVLLLSFFLVFQSHADEPEVLTHALKMFTDVSREAAPFNEMMHNSRGILVLNQSHPIAALQFNLETRQIEIFDQGLQSGVPRLASALAHEARHSVISTHVKCVPPSPLAGLEACDEKLPRWKDWATGGSYVYELAFKKIAIDLRVPGSEAYRKQLIGDLHIRFSQKPDLAVIDEWIGEELLESHKEFILLVRQKFYSPSKP